MFLQEAYNVLSSDDATLDELLSAHTVFAVEQGYLLAIVAREGRQDMQLELNLWKLVIAIELVKSKIKHHKD